MLDPLRPRALQETAGLECPTGYGRRAMVPRRLTGFRLRSWPAWLDWLKEGPGRRAAWLVPEDVQ